MDGNNPEHLKKFHSLDSRHVRGNFLLQRHDGPGVRDGQSIEVCVVLEDLHVAGEKVTEVPPDDVELIKVRLSRPKRFALI